MNSEKEHSWLSPSGFKPIMAGCVGKPFMEKGRPERPAGPSAARGTAIHKIAEEILLKGTVTVPESQEDLYEIALWYTHYVNQIILSEAVALTEIETKVNVFPEFEIFGTLDCAVQLQFSDTLHIIDLKTGRIPVTTKENWQLLGYAYGYILKHSLNCENIWLHVYQPGNPQEPWYVSRHTLMTEYVPRLESACKRAYTLYKEQDELSISNDLRVNDDCNYCRALGKCPAMRKHLASEALVLFEESPLQIPRVADLTVSQKVAVYKVKKLLLSYLEEIEASLRQDLADSVDVPELVIKPGKTVRKWASDEEYVASQLSDLGLEPYRKNLITITEAEKLLKKRKALLPQDVFITTQQRDQLVVKTLEYLDLLEDL